jgi:hypothetical protein
MENEELCLKIYVYYLHFNRQRVIKIPSGITGKFHKRCYWQTWPGRGFLGTFLHNELVIKFVSINIQLIIFQISWALHLSFAE